MGCKNFAVRTFLNSNQRTFRFTTPLSTDAATAKSTTASAAGGNDAKDEAVIVEKLKFSFDNDTSAGKVVPVHKRALLYGNKIAIKDEIGEYSYSQLYIGAKKLSIQISNLCGSASNSKVAFLCSNTALYTLVQWACWFSGQIAVPLSNRHPQSVLDYYIKDCEASLLITIPEYEKILSPLADKHQRPLIVVDHCFIPTVEQQPTSWLDPKNGHVLLFNGEPVIEGALDNAFYKTANAMILYTSGSTGNPKGTVISHKNIDAQVNCLTEAWDISAKDSLLHVLPLNHVHGCVNAMICPLSMGAKLFMLPKFESATVWSTLLNVNMPSKDRINVFMAVPTIYSFLIAEYDKTFSKNSRMVEYIRAQCEKKIRLMIAGSAPLPTTVFNKWADITGHKLLERYGMTEIGMALSNPYRLDKVRDRVPGSVGGPLPGVEVKLVNSTGETIVQVKGESEKGLWSSHELPVYQSTNPETAKAEVPKQPELIGELYIKGSSVFKEYLNRPDDTKKSFSNDGWFITGDEAKYENGQFRILGRSSVDIIKAGGYKVSALDIETILLEHPMIGDVCVVGVPDITWGQKIAAMIVPKNAEHADVPDLKTFCKKNLAEYESPSIIKYVKELPRNPMGKINKKEILKEYFIEKDAATST